MESGRPYPATVRQLAEEIHKLEADLDEERMYGKSLYDSLEFCVGALWETMHLTSTQNGGKGKQFNLYAEAVKLVGKPCEGCSGEDCNVCGGIGFVPK